MKIKYFVLMLLCLLLSGTRGFAADTDTIIKRVEDNLNGKTAFMKFTMTVKTKRSERTMKMDSYSIGKEKSFIKITYPKKDKGITFLKVDKSMWQYVPRIEKTIKIPASMMLQNWMGSDFTNDDLVRESSISEDYEQRIVAQNETEYEIELLPHEDAPVVWGRILMGVSKEYFLPTTVKYFDEDDVLVRILSYQNVKKFGKRFYPTHWVMYPKSEDKAGHQTIFDTNEAVFDEEISDMYFTKRALKRFSK
ncbi:MAG: outer membrane lipoprotein-sorting protein [Thermodesulfobacteriota bacterium]|nr:outer membrane lipoprotein-sorting protein [Thermodesulfobacteriota bacterium]